MTSTPPKQSDPFAIGDADTIRDLLVGQMGALSPLSNGVFRARAVALVGAMAPVLVWVRDHTATPIDLQQSLFAFQLRSICALATRGVFLVRDPAANVVSEVPVEDIPPELVRPLVAYLGELPGYDTDLPPERQRSDKPCEIHAYTLFDLTYSYAAAGAAALRA